MSTCKNCGETLGADSNYCPNCGTKVLSDDIARKNVNEMSKEELLKLLAEKDAQIKTLDEKIKKNEESLKAKGTGGSATASNENAKNDEEKNMKEIAGTSFYEKLSDEVKFMMSPEGIIEYGCEKQKELPKEKVEKESMIIKEKVKEYLKAFDDLDNSIREIENAKGTERYSALLEELDKRMMNDENVPRDVSIIYESIYTDRFLHCPTGRIVTEYGNYNKRIVEVVNKKCKNRIPILIGVCEVKLGINGNKVVEDEMLKTKLSSIAEYNKYFNFEI